MLKTLFEETHISDTSIDNFDPWKRAWFLGRPVLCYKYCGCSSFTIDIVNRSTRVRFATASEYRSRSRSSSLSETRSISLSPRMGRKPRAKRTGKIRHPPYIVMISQAITALKDGAGSSRQAIERYIQAHFGVMGDISSPLKSALKKGVATGRLLHTKGKGASGSFKLIKTVDPPKKKKKAAAKKTKPLRKTSSVANKKTKKSAARTLRKVDKKSKITTANH